MRFLGLTSDPPEDLDQVIDFVQATKVPWPNGYGATATFQQLDIEFLPTVLVVDRQGQVTWRSGARGTLEQAIDRALATP